MVTECFVPISAARQRCSFLPLPFSFVSEALASAIWQDKEMEFTQIRKKKTVLICRRHDYVYRKSDKPSEKPYTSGSSFPGPVLASVPRAPFLVQLSVSANLILGLCLDTSLPIRQVLQNGTTGAPTVPPSGRTQRM